MGDTVVTFSKRTNNNPDIYHHTHSSALYERLNCDWLEDKEMKGQIEAQHEDYSAACGCLEASGQHSSAGSSESRA